MAQNQGRDLALSPAEARKKYLLKIEGPLSTHQQIQEAASLADLPEIMEGKNDEDQDEEATFCIIDGKAKVAISAWLSAQNLDFKTTFIHLTGKAEKVLSPHSKYPTLGLGSTLPQLRASHNDELFLPQQDQYPVWYSFYGTLADPDILFETWAGKYCALVDG